MKAICSVVGRGQLSFLLTNVVACRAFFALSV